MLPGGSVRLVLGGASLAPFPGAIIRSVLPATQTFCHFSLNCDPLHHQSLDDVGGKIG